MTPVARAIGIRKHFEDPMGPRHWKDLVLSGRRGNRGIEALRGVDLELQQGAATAIVGANGAGKTTLLRILAGTLEPDGGHVERNGRIGSLLELGAGFHPDLTGRESSVLAAVIAGRSRREARGDIEAICDFAGLEGVMDRPLRTYSNGMRARLAFAIATQHRPDLLLVDEVLAVGDVAFQQRCIERLRDQRRDGTALAVVSHDPDLLAVLCDHAMWLDEGVVVAAGPVDTILDRYLQADRPAASPAGHATAAVTSVQVTDRDGRACRALNVGSALTVAVAVEPRPEPANLAVQLIREDDLLCIDTSTVIAPDQTGAVLAIDRLDLAPGTYRVDVALYDPSWQRVHGERRPAAFVRVIGTASAAAALAPPTRWSADGAGRQSGRAQH